MLINMTLASLMMLVTTIFHLAGISLVILLLKAHVKHWHHRHPFVRAYKIGEVVLFMFFLSVVEVSLWAFLYLSLGAIKKMETALYFSMVTFTTLGYGDVLIEEKWRLIAAFEAACGIIIFGMTTALIVAVVQRVYFSDASS